MTEKHFPATQCQAIASEIRGPIPAAPRPARAWNSRTSSRREPVLPTAARSPPPAGDAVSWFRLLADVEPSRLEIRDGPRVAGRRVDGLNVVGDVREAGRWREVTRRIIGIGGSSQEIEVLRPRRADERAGAHHQTEHTVHAGRDRTVDGAFLQHAVRARIAKVAVIEGCDVPNC